MDSSPLQQTVRTLAHANRLANRRLHAACLQLTPEEFMAPRTGFFPSLWATLNHILIVDWYYIAALYREATTEWTAAARLKPSRAAESLA